MRLLVVALRRQYNAKASVFHYGNCKRCQHCETRCKSVFNEPQASRNAGATCEAFLYVVYVERWAKVWMSRGIFSCEPLQNRKCMLNSTWRFFHRRQQQHVNTRLGCMPNTKYTCTAVACVVLDPTVWGQGVKYGRPPYLQYLFSICQLNMQLF